MGYFFWSKQSACASEGNIVDVINDGGPPLARADFSVLTISFHSRHFVGSSGAQ